MSDGRRYFYLGGEPIHSGIYADLIHRLGAEGLEMGLVARLRVPLNPFQLLPALKARERVGPNRVEDLRAKVPAGVFQLPMWNLWPGLSARSLAHLLRREAPGATIVLHTRQIVMATLGLTLKRSWPDVRIVAEIEGDDGAELDYRRALVPKPSLGQRIRWALERRHFEAENRRILKECDAVLCVSHNLRNVLIRRHGLNESSAARIHVMPTFASRENFRFDPGRRERTRSAGGWSGRFLTIYSGNLRGPWQVPHKLVEVFACIKARRPEAYFLVLTPDASDRQYIEPHLRRAGLSPEDWSIRSVPHHAIVDHLCAADVGLLLRDPHPMNEAASPGKFGEYTMTGLPIVMTEGIGDFSAQIRGHSMACVLPHLDDPNLIRERVQDFCANDFTFEERFAFSRWAGERFAIETVVPRLAALYRSV